MEKLGIELPLLLTQIVNFTIMLFILTKFLYKPILKGLSDRKKKIEEGLAFAEKAAREEEKLVVRKQELLKEAREEAKVIFENAKKDALKQKAEMIEDGKKEVALMKTKLEKEMNAKYDEMVKELTAKTVDIAAAMVKRVLGDVLTNEDQHRLIHKQLENLKGLMDDHDQALKEAVKLVNSSKSDEFVRSLEDSVEEAVKKSKGEHRAHVQSATSMNEQEKLKLEKELNKLLKRTVEVDYAVNPHLLGGFKIQLGDWKLDASLATQIETMKKVLGG